MKEPEELMQVTSEEIWEVYSGKETHRLDAEQAMILKQASKGNSRGIVWFKKFAISIPHISSVKLIETHYYGIEKGIKRIITRSEFERRQKMLIS